MVECEAGAGAKSKADSHASATVLGVCSSGVLVVGSSPLSPAGLAMLSCSAKGASLSIAPTFGRSITGSGLKVPVEAVHDCQKALAEATWEVLQMQPKDDEDPSSRFECIMLLPPSRLGEDTSKPPLIVVPHGGPHSCLPTSFIASYAYMCALQGYALLHVNFRGSTGFGNDFLNSLPGKIGTQDVADVLQATEYVCSTGLVDEKRVGILGGSHGGFLTCHMTSQFPGVYKAAATRNPVCNIPTMVTVTDIPDWCFVEALGIGSYDFDASRPPSSEAVTKMWEASPIRRVGEVKAPTLMAIGMKDRRVPPSQGQEWYHSIRDSVPAKMLLYPQDTHAIDKPLSDADHWVNVAAWMREHLKGAA
ncbi:unnamed protein product [Chrysoparadoxa australica]